jgi:hypothetical protein
VLEIASLVAVSVSPKVELEVGEGVPLQILDIVSELGDHSHRIHHVVI